MSDGVTKSSLDNNIADFIINEAYPFEVMPVSCILSGSRGYGLEMEESDYDYLGVHLMDSWECLQHPLFRKDVQVITRKFDREYHPVGESEPSYISLTSFEMWKFIELITKGSFLALEILYMPEIHHIGGSDKLISLCRGIINRKIGYAAKGIVFSNWGKDKTDRKKTVIAYYRLAQALHLLREEEFEWQAEALFNYIRPITQLAWPLYEEYKCKETRKTDLNLSMSGGADIEITSLLERVDQAMTTTSLPSESPKDVLADLLRALKQTRASTI